MAVHFGGTVRGGRRRARLGSQWSSAAAAKLSTRRACTPDTRHTSPRFQHTLNTRNRIFSTLGTRTEDHARQGAVARSIDRRPGVGPRCLGPRSTPWYRQYTAPDPGTNASYRASVPVGRRVPWHNENQYEGSLGRVVPYPAYPSL
eukprot:1339743-Rhodomonas_salina.2